MLQVSQHDSLQFFSVLGFLRCSKFWCHQPVFNSLIFLIIVILFIINNKKYYFCIAQTDSTGELRETVWTSLSPEGASVEGAGFPVTLTGSAWQQVQD